MSDAVWNSVPGRLKPPTFSCCSSRDAPIAATTRITSQTMPSVFVRRTASRASAE